MSGSNRGNTFRLPFSNILKTSMLIDQRCRLLIIISKCVSTHVVCGCRPTLPSVLAYTRTHTLFHSLSLRVSVFISFHIKTHLPQMSSIIEIQDSIVFGCSHFIKVALIRKLVLLVGTSFDLAHLPYQPTCLVSPPAIFVPLTKGPLHLKRMINYMYDLSCCECWFC